MRWQTPLSAPTETKGLSASVANYECHEMTNEANLPKVTDAAPSAAPSAAAKRMRLHRYRRKQGLLCITTELRDTEIDTLIRMGLLRNDMRNDLKAIKKALHEFLDDTLV